MSTILQVSEIEAFQRPEQGSRTIGQGLERTGKFVGRSRLRGATVLFGRFEQAGHMTLNRPKKRSDQEGAPEYFLHSVVKLRKPDRKGRQTLHAVLAIYKEAGHWCMRPASNEIAQKIIVASTQPAGELEQTQPSPGN